MNTKLEENHTFSKGMQALESNDLLQAIDIFRSLVIQHPDEKDYWYCLASCLQKTSQYELALKAWAMTELLNESDPFPSYFAAICYYHLKNPQEGLKAIRFAKKKISEQNHVLLEEMKSLESKLETL
ncbi:MAG: hypothetical protein COT84_08250 [Chlamydiae bacterium CG10_big_fil_rev_8_21_14_0_10_35_9]|nr:MAG: hypothetical protein COT84_08250 [Chlamydiae bacterium CG10_big_fil_rev_8_21_14_0_10_35_9]